MVSEIVLSIFYVVVSIFTLLVAMVVHELGHILAIKYYGKNPRVEFWDNEKKSMMSKSNKKFGLSYFNKDINVFVGDGDLTDDEYQTVLVSGVVAGAIPFFILLFSGWVDSLFFFICLVAYGLMCRHDTQQISRLVNKK